MEIRFVRTGPYAVEATPGAICLQLSYDLKRSSISTW